MEPVEVKREKLTCHKHPDYQAVRPPKADCLECRLIYRARQRSADKMLFSAAERLVREQMKQEERGT